ncbi:unnamed protein product [Pedinophyceae sp. YPF-701]|nr:unnamed protein product [Pedinophyceae sp. YPF-701]
MFAAARRVAGLGRAGTLAHGQKRNYAKSDFMNMTNENWAYLEGWEQEREKIFQQYQPGDWRNYAAFAGAFIIFPGIMYAMIIKERTYLDDQFGQLHTSSGYIGQTPRSVADRPVPEVGHIFDRLYNGHGVMNVAGRGFRQYNPFDMPHAKLGFGVTGSTMWWDQNTSNTGSGPSYYQSSGSFLGPRWKLGRWRKWDAGDPWSWNSDEY